MSKPKRKKLWELNKHYHCAVIGTCLSLPELRKIGRRMRLRDLGRRTDYQLHATIVGNAEKATPPIRLVNKALDAKFRQGIQRFNGAGTEAELALLWEEAVAGGQVAEAFWALLTHPVATDALRERAQGEVHMLSHLSGASS